jgi:hypothetical protein
MMVRVNPTATALESGSILPLSCDTSERNVTLAMIQIPDERIEEFPSIRNWLRSSSCPNSDRAWQEVSIPKHWTYMTIGPNSPNLDPRQNCIA